MSFKWTLEGKLLKSEQVVCAFMLDSATILSSSISSPAKKKKKNLELPSMIDNGKAPNYAIKLSQKLELQNI